MAEAQSEDAISTSPEQMLLSEVASYGGRPAYDGLGTLANSAPETRTSSARFSLAEDCRD